MTSAEQDHFKRVVASHALNANSLPSDDRRADIVARHLAVVVDQVPDPRDPRKSLPVPRVAVVDAAGGERRHRSLTDGSDGPYPVERFVAELAQSTPELRW